MSEFVYNYPVTWYHERAVWVKDNSGDLIYGKDDKRYDSTSRKQYLGRKKRRKLNRISNRVMNDKIYGEYLSPYLSDDCIGLIYSYLPKYEISLILRLGEEIRCLGRDLAYVQLQKIPVRKLAIYLKDQRTREYAEKWNSERLTLEMP